MFEKNDTVKLNDSIDEGRAERHENIFHGLKPNLNYTVQDCSDGHILIGNTWVDAYYFTKVGNFPVN